MGGLGGNAPQPAANPVIGKRQLYDFEPAGSPLRRPLFCHGFHGVFRAFSLLLDLLGHK